MLDRITAYQEYKKSFAQLNEFTKGIIHKIEDKILSEAKDNQSKLDIRFCINKHKPRVMNIILDETQRDIQSNSIINGKEVFNRIIEHFRANNFTVRCSRYQTKTHYHLDMTVHWGYSDTLLHRIIALLCWGKK